MNIIDATEQLLTAYENGQFRLEKWKAYMHSSLPQAEELCLRDLEESLAIGLSWEKDYLPVLNAVPRHAAQCRETVRSFYAITDHLAETISAKFGRTPDADIILYLGLCSGAGWVTAVNGKTVVLLGIEKIVELDWFGLDAMNGLILHELGHVYQAQYGVLHRKLDSPRDQFLWQLFTEGIAMVFEQEIVGDPDYFHQDCAGWKSWCSEHVKLIRDSFLADLDSMTRADQRYFGDWADFDGHGDVGYYLGARFIRFLLTSARFDDLISYDIEDVRRGFEKFAALEL